MSSFHLVFSNAAKEIARILHVGTHPNNDMAQFPCPGRDIVEVKGRRKNRWIPKFLANASWVRLKKKKTSTIPFSCSQLLKSIAQPQLHSYKKQSRIWSTTCRIIMYSRIVPWKLHEQKYYSNVLRSLDQPSGTHFVTVWQRESALQTSL